MNDNGQRDNGRHKADQCKSIHAQWMMPPYQMKDSYTMKMIAMMAERDTALQERNKALAEKREALSERDKSYLQRDAALAERNNAIMERDKAFAALEALRYSRDNGVTDNGGSGCPPGCNVPLVLKHTHHLHHQQQQQQHQQQQQQPPHAHTAQLSDALFDHEREMNMNNGFPVSTEPGTGPKARRGRRPKKETNVQTVQPRKPLKTPRKRTKKNEATGEDREVPMTKPLEWKGQDLGLNLVAFDDTTMPVPLCSCTGEFHQCYKWGNGGWQSACCTMTMSLFPLPMIPNKRHTRVGGRKMSGSAFSKLLSRLAAEGHDLSVPLDLKDHWAKHGTNRYITIK